MLGLFHGGLTNNPEFTMSGRISQQRRAMDIGYLRDGISSTFSKGRNGPAYTEEENVELDGIPWYQYRALICQILPIRQSFLPTAPPTCDRSSFTSRRELFSSDDMPNKLNSVESRFVQPSFSIKHLDSLSILPPHLIRISQTDRSWILDSIFEVFTTKVILRLSFSGVIEVSVYHTAKVDGWTGKIIQIQGHSGWAHIHLWKAIWRRAVYWSKK